MSATVWGNEIKYTKRFQLGQLLGKITRHFLLLTATPHNGKEEDFYLFMSLIAPDRFEGAKRLKNRVDVSDIMRRLVKEDLVTFEGKPLFPERIAYTVNYSLSPQEAELYRNVTNYVADGFNRAERLTGDKKNSVGFAMTILQRRLASSPKAIYKSLERRTQRLKKILQEKKLTDEDSFDVEDWDEYEEFPNIELERKEDEFAARATASKTLRELRNEIQTLEQLTVAANGVCKSGDDKKWSELSRLLQDNEKIAKPYSSLEKLIIFTEHRDTLDYLQQRISSLFGRTEMVATIHGGLNRNERRAVEERFKRDKNLLVLVATDAAGEGINLQNAHLMINYDLPWNPNRLEQRFGRIHRIGQKEVCHLWNLVADDTREGQVFLKLLKKIEEERAALGGQIYWRGSGRYEITRVPVAVRNKALRCRFAEPIAGSYERICFAKENCHIAGMISAILLAPTNPLLDAVSALTLEKFGDALKQGTILSTTTTTRRIFACFSMSKLNFRTGGARSLPSDCTS